MSLLSKLLRRSAPVTTCHTIGPYLIVCHNGARAVLMSDTPEGFSILLDPRWKEDRLVWFKPDGKDERDHQPAMLLMLTHFNAGGFCSPRLVAEVYLVKSQCRFRP